MNISLRTYVLCFAFIQRPVSTTRICTIFVSFQSHFITGIHSDNIDTDMHGLGLWNSTERAYHQMRNGMLLQEKHIIIKYVLNTVSRNVDIAN
jgi:hypothetical protein